MPKNRHYQHYQRAPFLLRGMALIIVLWMLAALSLFAASLGGLVRNQAQQAAVQRNLVQAQAAGEAAIYLALQKMQQENRRPTLEQVSVDFAGQRIEVQFQPWSGLVNINQAPVATWRTLLQGAADLGAQQAAALAQAIVATREQMRQQQERAFPQPWETPHDLLQVPGMHYGIYIRLQPYLVASTQTSRSVVQNAAPPPLLRWLQAQAPEQLQAGSDNDRLYIVQAWVALSDGAVQVQRHLAWQHQSSTQLPWLLLASSATWQPSQLAASTQPLSP